MTTSKVKKTKNEDNPKHKDGQTNDHQKIQYTKCNQQTRFHKKICKIASAKYVVSAKFNRQIRFVKKTFVQLHFADAC